MQGFFIMWYLVNFIQIILILVVCIFSMTIAIPLGIIGLPSWSMKIGKYFWGPLLVMIVGGRVKVEGVENYDPSKPVIFTANHLSHYDIVCLFVTVPSDLYFIAKKELKKVPFLGWSIAALGMIFIDRSDRKKAMQSMKEAGNLIRKGKNVITFPEGTRSKNGQVNLFKRGTFIIAKESEIDVLPIAIKGTDKFHRPGTYKFRPGKAVVKLGKPISAQKFKDKTPEEFAKHTELRVRELFDSIQL